jgi:Tfp pilus assembly protein PilF
MHQKRYAEATLAFKRAVALEPQSADTHSNLSWALYRGGFHADAEAEAALAIKFEPKSAVVFNAMGNALFGQGRHAEAVSFYRKALEITPKDGVMQMNLGRSLYRSGEIAEGFKALTSSVQALPAGSPNRNVADKELKECERALGIDKQIQAFRDKSELPKSSKLVLEMADVAQRYQQHHNTAVALYGRIFVSKADLTDELIGDHRYHAAGAALLAAGGKALDLPKPSVVKQGQLRAEALRWLRAELDRATKRSEAGKSEETPYLVDRIARWKTDQAISRMSDPKVLDALSADEQTAWRELWSDADLFVKVTRVGMMQMTIEGTLGPAARLQAHDLKLLKGKTYVFDLECTVFDPLLRLDGPDGKKLAESEDVGSSPRMARLVIKAPADGVYRLTATSVREAGVGAYNLRMAVLRDAN